MHLAFAAASDRGLIRQQNEDRSIARPELGLFAVVDGMGGHAGGQRAAETIADALTDFIARTATPSDDTWPFGLDLSLSMLANRLQVAMRVANGALAAVARQDAAMANSGATVAAALVGPESVVISHFGDCRAYLVRAGHVTQITRDHSLVAEQIAMGLIDAEDARRHPLRHVVTRAMSGQEAITVDLIEIPIAAGDRLLLCSDGVHGVLTDGELTAHATTDALDAICPALVDRVKEEGAPDNATIVVVDIA